MLIKFQYVVFPDPWVSEFYVTMYLNPLVSYQLGICRVRRHNTQKKCNSLFRLFQGVSFTNLEFPPTGQNIYQFKNFWNYISCQYVLQFGSKHFGSDHLPLGSKFLSISLLFFASKVLKKIRYYLINMIYCQAWCQKYIIL